MLKLSGGIREQNPPFGIDVQARPAVRKAGGHAVAVALKCDQTRRRYPFAVPDDPIESRWPCHQARLLSVP